MPSLTFSGFSDSYPFFCFVRKVVIFWHTVLFYLTNSYVTLSIFKALWNNIQIIIHLILLITLSAILQMKTLGHVEIILLVQGLTASKWQS